MLEQPLHTSLFEEDYLLRELGQVAHVPQVALTELVANAWDAGASKVEVGLSRDNGRQEAILKSFSWRLPCIHLLAVTTPMSSRPKRLR